MKIKILLFCSNKIKSQVAFYFVPSDRSKDKEIATWPRLRSHRDTGHLFWLYYLVDATVLAPFLFFVNLTTFEPYYQSRGTIPSGSKFWHKFIRLLVDSPNSYHNTTGRLKQSPSDRSWDPVQWSQVRSSFNFLSHSCHWSHLTGLK